MNYRVQIDNKEDFLSGTLLLNNGENPGIVCGEDQTSLAMINLAFGVWRFKSKQRNQSSVLALAEATKDEWLRLFANDNRYFRILTPEEDVDHIIFIYERFGKENAEKLSKEIRTYLAEENAAEDVLREFDTNMRVMFNEEKLETESSSTEQTKSSSKDDDNSKNSLLDIFGAFEEAPKEQKASKPNLGSVSLLDLFEI